MAQPMTGTTTRTRTTGIPDSRPSLLFLPLHLFTLILLHVLLAFSRLFNLLHHLHLSPSVPSPPTSTLSLLRRDRSRWSKTPTHLAIVFAPGTNWREYFGVESQKEAEWRRVLKQVRDLERLIEWSKELEEVDTITVYDELGTLKRYSEAVISILENKSMTIVEEKNRRGTTSFKIAVFPSTSFPKEDEDVLSSDTNTNAVEHLILHSSPHIKDVISSLIEEEQPISSASSSTLVQTNLHNSHLPTSSSRSVTECEETKEEGEKRSRRTFIRVNLLGREDGREKMASVTRGLVENIKRRGKGKMSVEDGEIVEAVEASMITEPSLLLVLGGPYLRLHGFPPWQLRLTEISHHSSPHWLPEPELGYEVFRRGMDVYGGAEMRLGR